MICGIDEAGRGPMIGPLVISGVLTDNDGISRLKKLGVKDSKLISPSRRRMMFKEIKKLVKYKTYIIKPLEIDETILSNSSNLNWLEADYQARIINDLKPKTAIIDSPSASIKKYTEYLAKKVKINTKLIVENKADLNYIIVGAASIIAKVTRDDEILKIEKETGKLGSGYPADPITKKFLDKNFDKYPHIFRKTWGSYKNKLKEKSQTTLSTY